jgi:hypothetical protein
MTSEDLTPEQVRRLAAQVTRASVYLARLCERMERRGFPIGDPVYSRAISARNSVQALLTHIGDVHKVKVTPPNTSVTPRIGPKT